MAAPHETEALLSALLQRLAQDEGAALPTTALGRLRRTAGAAMRTGAGALVGRLAGRGGWDPKALDGLVLSLGELKGVAMKLGQILSYIDPSMPEDARKILSVLQARSQPTPFPTVERLLREELPAARAAELLATIEKTPVATASIGQVHRAALPDGTPVAVKVRHPGIDDAIRADFRGAAVGKTMAKLLVPGADIAQLVEEAEARFLEECDYALEARHQQRFFTLYGADGGSDIEIPAVHGAYSAARVLTTTWRTGAKLEDFAATAEQAARDRAGRALWTFYIGALYRHGLFNADPHPGNVLFRPDGGIIVLDHGCVRVFDAGTVRQLAQLSKAVREDDHRAIREALRALGAKNPEGAGFDLTRSLLRAFYGPVLEPGPRRMTSHVSFDFAENAKNKRAVLKLQLPGKLLFLFRIRFGLHAVLTHVGAVLDWAALEEALTSEVLR